MSACFALILPQVHAFAARYIYAAPRLPVGAPPSPLEPHLAFYRKYTQALLRRYARMAQEAGKIPSMIGQEMLRHKMSNYRVDSFDDVVIFLADIDHCLQKLDPPQQHLVTRIAIQEFTIGEVAAALALDPRTVINRYNRALDRLTGFFLHTQILQPLKHCQEAKSVENQPTDTVSIT
jgi:uncharacterized coiled-coil protein SlyX